RHTRFSRDWSSDVCSSDLDVRLAEHALLDALLDDGPEQPLDLVALGDVFGKVLIPQAAVLAQEDGGTLRVLGDEPGVSLHGGKELLRAGSVGGDDGLHIRDKLVHARLKDGEQDFLFAAEVVVQAGFLDI